MERVALSVRDRADVTLVAAGSLLVASLVGVAIAAQIPVGLALLLGVLYIPLVFTHFQIALCLWIPLVFLEGLPAFNLGSKAIAILLVFGWIASWITGANSRTVLTRHRRLLETVVLLAAWLTLSLAWAPNTAQGVTGAWRWWAVALVLVIFATAVTTPELLSLAIAMYVAGAVLSVAIGALTGAVAPQDNRLPASVGDPNFLAAALVASIPLAFALSVVRPTVGFRFVCFVTVGILAIGVVASQSRGGLVAAVASWLAAVVVLPRRKTVLAIGVGVLAVVVAAFVLNPASWHRVTENDPRGTGRVDIWTVAWGIFRDHPVTGIGVANFGRVAPDYVRDVGPLENVQLVVKTPDRTVHNSYLELLAENGIPALVLFLLISLACMRATLRAAREFAASGRPDLAALSNALFVGTVGILASFVFLSPAVDRRLWILFGLSLAALDIARRGASERTSVEAR